MSIYIEKLIQDDLDGRINTNSREQFLRKYYNNPNYCKYCGEIIRVGKNQKPSETRRKNFCNNSCAASYNNKNKERKHKYCLNCNTEISLRNIYCSIKCQHEYEQKDWENKWLSGEIDGNTDSIWLEPSKRVKNYLFRIYNNKCARCGWGEINQYTGTIPLEVEHLDGNSQNTTPENVTLLCPNCHALTPTYRGANKGNGRRKTWIPYQIETDI